MSHFVKNTKVFVTDKQAFVKACREMGLNGQVKENCTIKAMNGETAKAAIAVNVGSYDIGLVETAPGSGQFNLMGEYWYMSRENPSVRNMNPEQIQNTLLQNTTKNTIKDKYEAIGFDVNVEPQKSGDMQITLTRSESRY
jgi:hypothetical protein